MAFLAILLVSYCDGLEEIPGIALFAELLGMFEGSQAHGFTLIRVLLNIRMPDAVDGDVQTTPVCTAFNPSHEGGKL